MSKTGPNWLWVESVAALERENNANKALLKDAAMQVTEKEAEVTRLREALRAKAEFWVAEGKRCYEIAHKRNKVEESVMAQAVRFWECARELNEVLDTALAASAPQARIPRCQATHPEDGQCELREGHVNEKHDHHLAGIMYFLTAEQKAAKDQEEITSRPREIPIGTVIPKWGKVVKAGRAYWVSDDSGLAEAVDAGMLEALYADQAGTTQAEGSGK